MAAREFLNSFEMTQSMNIAQASILTYGRFDSGYFPTSLMHVGSSYVPGPGTLLFAMRLIGSKKLKKNT